MLVDMASILFTVESTVVVRGRGSVLLPGVPLAQHAAIQIGQTLAISHPDGSLVRVQVRGIEHPPSLRWIGERPADPCYGILVDSNDVPAGSVVMVD